MAENRAPPGPPVPEQGAESGGGIFKMLIIQTIQGFIIGRKKWSFSKKIACLSIILVGLLHYDITNYLQSK